MELKAYEPSLIIWNALTILFVAAIFILIVKFAIKYFKRKKEHHK